MINIMKGKAKIKKKEMENLDVDNLFLELL
jgi:hypothetical protein